ncbi:glutathione S-transferase [Erwinia sp. OLTSP20]|uniref:glutathione S-transferase family protein n=1 Tax=unclassified Erwinia TaxID=2622719 RepID=UPI000C1A346A|nr:MULTISPECIES: glutathione S-transferase [unclassified Erwinia]PIJ50383.1 glutathione S-transferase [Erwinia sp. OAMSP11]PIJ71642.1 glutathione S-transferase [Erwinia sp. OLSSP12]PIJ81026.1 glutathione S-transferase [Erwinia sp. OLCASP19]PIJ83284.1 glutathione S-transferase [Erwinia sp. OLMTSP26]PIJ85964.1 glutathione S-transferase [Erwinia sp. OLMDSP33]
MITVHHLNQSRSLRIVWMLEELALPYQLVRYQREPTLLAPVSLKEIHPLGKSPVIVDDGLVLAESGAILEYLVEQYDPQQQFMPRQADVRQQARYWLHYAEGSLMPLLVMRLIFNRLGKAPTPWLLRPAGRMLEQGIRKGYLDRQLKNHQQFIEQHLGEQRWFAGDHFTIADVQMSFPLQALMARHGQSENIQAWLDKIAQRDAWQRAILRAGKIDLSE